MHEVPIFIIRSDKNPESCLYAGKELSQSHDTFFVVDRIDENKWSVRLASGTREQLRETIDMAGFEIESEKDVSY